MHDQGDEHRGHRRHLPFLGAADGEREPVDAFDDDLVSALQRAALVERRQPRAPERAVEEHLAGGARTSPTRPTSRSAPLRTRLCEARERLAHDEPRVEAADERRGEARGRPRRRRSARRRRRPGAIPAAAASAAVPPSTPCEGTCASAAASATPMSSEHDAEGGHRSV